MTKFLLACSLLVAASCSSAGLNPADDNPDAGPIEETVGDMEVTVDWDNVKVVECEDVGAHEGCSQISICVDFDALDEERYDETKWADATRKDGNSSRFYCENAVEEGGCDTASRSLQAFCAEKSESGCSLGFGSSAFLIMALSYCAIRVAKLLTERRV